MFDFSELDESKVRLGSASFAVVRQTIDLLSNSPRILELGSGASTRALAFCFPNSEVISVDHDRRFMPVLADLPPNRVTLKVCPLKLICFAGVVSYTYSFQVDAYGAFDVAIVDGPPSAIPNGRLGASLLAYSALRPGGRLFIDDASRPGELSALSALVELAGATMTFHNVGHGLAEIIRTRPVRAMPLVSLRTNVDMAVGVARRAHARARRLI